MTTDEQFTYQGPYTPELSGPYDDRIEEHPLFGIVEHPTTFVVDTVIFPDPSIGVYDSIIFAMNTETGEIVAIDGADYDTYWLTKNDIVPV
jgi:hypothetical protein